MKVPCPSVRIAARSDESVRLRGTITQPTILISPRSLLTWSRDSTAHAVQLSHEMGHVWAQDLGRSYFLSTGVLLLAAEVLPIAATSTAADLFLILAAAISALLSLRSFLQSREHAADFLAAQVLGASARDALPDADMVEDRLPRLLRAHPSPAQRRRAFGDPAILFSNMRLPMFSLGYSGMFALDMTTAVYRALIGGGSRTIPLQVMLVPSTLFVGVLLGGLLRMGAVLVTKEQIKSWLRAFLLGALTCLLILTVSQEPLPVKLSIAIVCYGALVIIARLMAPLPQVISVLFAKVEELYVFKHRLLQSVMPALAWAGFIEFYYFRGYSPLAHLLTRIPPLSWL